MNQAMITIVAPLDQAMLATAQTAIDALGNPARADLAARLRPLDGALGIHFASMHALPSFTADKAHLILEFSADGDQQRAIAQLVLAMGAELAEVFALARDWRGGDIGGYLTRHVIATGFGLGASPGIGHCGAPGMSVGRIKAEAALTAQIQTILASQGGGMSALDRLDAVRGQLAASHADALTPAAVPVGNQLTGAGGAIAPALKSFVSTYLTPWLLGLGLLWLLLTIGLGWSLALHRDVLPDNIGLVAAVAVGAAKIAIALLVVFAIGFVIFAAAVFLRLRQLEASDWVSDRAPDPATLHAIIARENEPGYAQNHMVSLTQIKPGWLRSFTLRLVFWAIATVGPLLYKAGHLGAIGTIHFARWVTVPGTRDFLFFSNYGGSWESYLEDFITLSHTGLTGVWSNTVGFPKTTNLIGGGATDGERFKRYARQSMHPTRFWYSAYPELTTDMIRANADTRRGLSGAMTEDDAAAWLSRFGSALRPDNKLVSNEIQSLVFGGLGFLPYATCTLWRLPADQAEARAWLRALSPELAWNDGKRIRDDQRNNAIYQLGLSASGLAALGLPGEGLASFPAAFLDGMDTTARARIIGDTGSNAREHWWWTDPADAAVLVYGETPTALATLRKNLDRLAKAHGAALVKEIKLRVLDSHVPRAEPVANPTAMVAAPALETRQRELNRTNDREPFGFADGGSQPVIRGTYKGERDIPNSMHLVAPGEFVLGYPDNRGNLPPGPCMAAIHDPDNILPTLGSDPSFATNTVNQPRDLGCNGSFLVIRVLEQDVDGFHAYCKAEAKRLQHRLAAPYSVTPEFIGAKMMGRWQNGAPLVRSPYSASKAPQIITENNFKLGFEDPEGLRCPFGSHIRRANPRDSLDPGSLDQIAITNRHRILRIGRKYQPAKGHNPGLLFMCLNGDLERQFEFVQQTWINGNVISLSCPINLAGEADPLLGGDGNAGFTIPSRDGPVKLAAMKSFVTMRGGGYFFMPGKRLVRYLAGKP